MATLDAQTLTVDALAVVAAALYLVVGRFLARRRVSHEARGPLRGFVLWWIGLGAVSLVGVVLSFFDLAQASAAVVRIILYAIFLVYIALMVGLLYYLTYLYTGRSWLVVLSLAYTALFALLVYIIERENVGKLLSEGYEPVRDVWSLVLTLAFTAPPLAAALAYFALIFRVEDRTSRYRIAMVSGGIALWFAYSTIASALRFVSGATGQSFAGQVAGQLLGLLAAAMVLLAYLPPSFVRRRFGIVSLADEMPAEEESPRRQAGMVSLRAPTATEDRSRARGPPAAS